MRKLFFIVVGIFSCLTLNVANAAGSACKALPIASTEDLAKSYMKQHGLILEGDELNFPDMGIKTQWKLVKIEPIKNGCLVVMAVCGLTEKAGASCEGLDPIEVLGVRLEKSSPVFVKFEDLYEVSEKVIAKIGHPDVDDPSYYYAELTGKSAVNATKSMIAKIPYYGFSGIAVLGNKASFDPTLNRNWKIVNASFDLRRGLTAEVLDVQAYQFDGDDAEVYWRGCLKSEENQHGTCLVAPWGQAFVREIKAIK